MEALKSLGVGSESRGQVSCLVDRQDRSRTDTAIVEARRRQDKNDRGRERRKFGEYNRCKTGGVHADGFVLFSCVTRVFGTERLILRHLLPQQTVKQGEYQPGPEKYRTVIIIFGLETNHSAIFCDPNRPSGYR